jgi:hypothetical protein
MLGNNAESTGEISGKRLGNADIQIEITLALATACLGEEPQLIPIEALMLGVPHPAWAEQMLKLSGLTVAEVLPMLRRLHRELRAEEAAFGAELEQLLGLMGPGMLSHVFEAQAIASSGSISST